MRLRRDFYSKHPNQLPSNPEDRGEVTEQFIYSSDETICLSLEYADDPQGREDVEEENESQLNGKRFLRCPAAVTVGLLKRLIRGKYGLDFNHALDILYGDSFLCDEYSLVDLAYIYNWRRKGPMRLKYRIYQRTPSSTPLTNGTNGNEEASQKIKEEDIVEDKKKTNEVQHEISGCGVMSVPNTDAKNGRLEETQPIIPTTISEKSEEVKVPSPEPETSTEAPSTECPAVSIDVSADTNGKTPVSCPTSIGAKIGDSVEVKTAIIVSENYSISTTTTATTSTDTTSNSPASHLTSSARNKVPTSVGQKTLKPPSTSWNHSVNRVGIKRTSSSVACNDSGNLSLANPEQTLPTPAKRATPSSPSKTPRFFKVRNASQPSCIDTNGVTSKATGTSIASVTESPVQEVAVNLTKAFSSPKKPIDKDRSLREGKEGKAPSPRPDSGSNPIRPYSVPAPSQSKRQPSPNLAAEDAAARLRHLLNPISSTAATTTSPSSADNSVQQLRFPAAAWLNLARGVPNRPVPLALGPGSPFNNRPPLSPAHFISSFIASHPHYPYLSPMGLPPAPDGKKSLPSSTASSSSSSSSSSSVPSQQTHKSISPRTSNSFPTPTFNLNTLQQCTYPSSLSPLLPNLPRELVGSFYHSSYVPRPFMSARGGPLSVSSKSLSSSSSLSSGGGFHPSMPPTVTTTTSNSSSSVAGRKSSPGLRPTVPRRNVAPPPPLVPIGTPSSVRSPPTLLPIKDVVEKESTSAKSTPSNCTTVVESCVPLMEDDVVKSGSVSKSTDDKPVVDSTSENQHPPAQENGKVIEEVGSGKADIPTTLPLECSVSKTTSDNVNLVLENKCESKVEIAATAPS